MENDLRKVFNAKKYVQIAGQTLFCGVEKSVPELTGNCRIKE